MALEQKESHFREGLVKLIGPLWGKPRVASILYTFLHQLDLVEAATWDVFERYTIAGADTTRLDVLGRIVGAPRYWSNDETYRAVISGKIRANRSRGLTDDVIDVLRLVAPTDGEVHVEHYAPATALVWLETGFVDPDHLVAVEFLLPKTRAAGVQLHFFYTDDEADTGAIWDESTWDSGAVYWNEAVL